MTSSITRSMMRFLPMLAPKALVSFMRGLSDCRMMPAAGAAFRLRLARPLFSFMPDNIMAPQEPMHAFKVGFDDFDAPANRPIGLSTGFVRFLWRVSRRWRFLPHGGRRGARSLPRVNMTCRLSYGAPLHRYAASCSSFQRSAPVSRCRRADMPKLLRCRYGVACFILITIISKIIFIDKSPRCRRRR